MSTLRRYLDDARPGTPPGDPRASPDAPGALPAGPLARFLGPRPRAGEVCELCAAAVDDEHRHIVDLQRQSLLCACRACGLLFTGSGAAGGRYRVVPERYLRLEPFVVSSEQWAALQVPVGTAFFLRRSEPAGTVAFYPSPAGATESELGLDAWNDVVTANPALRDLEEDTEAALVRFRAGDAECYVVPVDRCYELVGELRVHWRGFDGGQEVRERIERFFAGLRARSRPAGGEGP